uniref:(California timema) hypothetical protein n=1 Tax=Timema californicum TaxID=61474 RepID=A0A7R9P3V7_TIMCA|nr:unnamed protein product [Timema californicum]
MRVLLGCVIKDNDLRPFVRGGDQNQSSNPSRPSNKLPGQLLHLNNAPLVHLRDYDIGAGWYIVIELTVSNPLNSPINSSHSSSTQHNFRIHWWSNGMRHYAIKVGEFEWSSTLQGFILSAFYYGYITTQIIGGRLAEKYGAKFIMGPGLMAAGIMSLFTPLAARYHVAAFAVVRILTGVFAGNAASFSPMRAGQTRKQTIGGIKSERDQLTENELLYLF